MLKYDNCNVPYDNVTMENEYGRYVRMQEAIGDLAAKYHESPFIYSLTQWGWEGPQVIAIRLFLNWYTDCIKNWAPRIAQGWRIDNDIKPYWSSISTVLWLASRMYLATK